MNGIDAERGNVPVIVPVILSGGAGTRLWPLSRAMYPKQFIRFFEDQQESFLCAALTRLGADHGFAPPIILCNNDHRFLVRDEVERAGVSPAAIVLEPVARNTAPAVTAAALTAERQDPNAIIVVMPSDHVIGDVERFTAAVRRAAAVAATGRLVLFGIKPTEPHTGYGYIQRGAPVDAEGDVFAVQSFTEKPDRATAEHYLADATYFWNSGIFVLNVRTYLQEVARLAPKVLDAARKAVANASTDLGFLRLDKAAFAASPSISIDYAVMERTNAAAVVPLDLDWSDVGSWSSLWTLAPRNSDGNFVNGYAVTEDTSNCYIHSETALVTTIGVSDLVIVNTPDALLVTDKARAQDVSVAVSRLKALGRKEYEQHTRSYRPWGYFETLSIGGRFQVKLLHVKPGGRLSLQMHHHRSEHWVVVQGTAKVTIGDEARLVRENESIYITATQWHRLENPGKVPIELIEVQIGTYLGEDDIIRSDDIYARDPAETK